MIRQEFGWHEITAPARWALAAERLRPAIHWTNEVSRDVLEMAATLLTPTALLTGILAGWRLGSDLGFAGDFFIEDGVFSHWQVWMAITLGLQSSAVTLKKHLKNNELQPKRAKREHGV